MKKLGLALSVLASGCYLNHGVGDDTDGGRRDTSRGPCLAEGTYEVPARFVSISPAGCFDAMPSTVPIRIPPRPEDFAAMCSGDVGVVGETAPCQWSVEAVCAIPDASSAVSGTIDARDGTVRGELDVTQSGLAGECRFRVILGG